MATELREFGTTRDGRPVRAARLTAPGGLTLEVIEYGAAIRSLQVPTARGLVETVLGFDTLGDYETDPTYQGVIAGRVANRIAGGAFSIEGERFEVTANEGANTLHGGALGLSRRLWRIIEVGERRLTLAYVSPDGEEGFPGTLECQVAFTLVGDDAVQVVWEAETDRASPVSLTHHPYFNLSGDTGHAVLDHSLSIRADAITPVRPDLIPTGEFLPVEGTPFDLRQPRRLAQALAGAHPQLALAGDAFDHNWVLSGGPGPALTLASPTSGITMEVETDQPGIQVYAGQGLAAPFVRHGGLVIEPQGFPDAVNQPGFPETVLQPDDRYRRFALYRFRTGG